MSFLQICFSATSLIISPTFPNILLAPDTLVSLLFITHHPYAPTPTPPTAFALATPSVWNALV